VFTRVAVGRAQVVREVRAAAPLMARLRAPVTARGPWLTAVLNAGAARRFSGRPVAVVVEAHRQGRPDAAAFLLLRRRGPVTVVTMLGDGAAPPGAPGARLLARDEDVAGLLAAGIDDLLRSLRRPRQLRLAGLPLGDPTARQLSARLPDGVLATARTRALCDDLDDDGPVIRSRDPRVLDRWLPALVTREGDARARDFLRAAARLHAAIDQVELAVVADGNGPRAALLTLLDGADRRPWWGFAPGGPLPTRFGSPAVSLTAPARDWPPVPRLRGPSPWLRSYSPWLRRKSAAR
jgi:hypothetical protein